MEEPEPTQNDIWEIEQGDAILGQVGEVVEEVES